MVSQNFFPETIVIRFRLRELLLEKERREGRTIRWAELAEATKISVATLSHIGSLKPYVVTNTAYVESLCRYFDCPVQDLVVFEMGPDNPYDGADVDRLYPHRRSRPEEAST